MSKFAGPRLRVKVAHQGGRALPSFVWEYYPETGFLKKAGGADKLGVLIGKGKNLAELVQFAREAYPNGILHTFKE